MSSEMRHLDGQEIQTPASPEARLWDQALGMELPWDPLDGTPPEGNAFPVDWQLSPDGPAASSERQISRDEEARTFQNRLRRLYRVCPPPPELP